MKKILGLAAGLMLTAITFGQATATFTDATPEYDKAATTSLNFIFSPAHSAEDIKSSAAYYESYFTVGVTDAGSAGNKVSINLVEDNEMARRVILRLLVSTDVKAVNVNGTEYDRNDFVTQFIVNE